jgi:sirohydrochlorin ferrochelatase
LDDAPELVEALAERAKSIAVAPRDQGLFLVAHGPSDAEDATRWMKNLRLIANGVKYDAGFADVRVGLLQDDAPKEVRAEAVRRIREIIELQHRVTNRPVIVVPVLVSRGGINNDKIPRDLAGLPIKYTGAPLLPHAALERWVLREVAAYREVTAGGSR